MSTQDVVVIDIARIDWFDVFLSRMEANPQSKYSRPSGPRTPT